MAHRDKAVLTSRTEPVAVRGRGGGVNSTVISPRIVTPLVVGIAGATGSGKTAVARRLATALEGSVVLLAHDRYYRDRSDLGFEARCGLNFDHPDALETSLLVDHVQRLRAGERVKLSVYNFAEHRRKPDRVGVEPAPIILVEGILVLADELLRSLLDLKIWVETDGDLRVFRRVRRDIEERGRSFESVRRQYYATVRPMTLEFVEPSRRFADIIVPEGGDNDVAMDLLVAKLRSVVLSSYSSTTS